MKLFAVTDHFHVLELEIVDRRRRGSRVQYETRLAGSVSEYCQHQWRLYYHFIWSHHIKQESVNVFRSKKKAYDVAIEEARERRSELSSELDTLSDTIGELTCQRKSTKAR